jgi:hypothetical protein
VIIPLKVKVGAAPEHDASDWLDGLTDAVVDNAADVIGPVGLVRALAAVQDSV